MTRFRHLIVVSLYLSMALSLGLSLGCAVDESLAPAPPPSLPPLPAAPPDALGPYGVGFTTMEIDDGSDTGRTLPVEIWYPATVEPSAPVGRYALMLGTFKVTELASPAGGVRDGALDLRGAPHPVVLFSHGYGGTRLQNIYLCEHLASHGFVVAAPDHVGNTFAELINVANAVSSIDSARVRPRDLSRTLDVLLERADRWPDDLLAFAADQTRVGVAGHSFGGFTAFRIAGATVDMAAADAACAADPDNILCDGYPGDEPFPASARDERVIAALPQAPGGALVFEPDGYSTVTVPTMIQAGTTDATTPYAPEAQAPYAQLAAPAYLLTIEDAGHFTFSDMCLLMDLIGLEDEAFDDGCSAANIPSEEAHRTLNRFATAFFKVYVAGDDSYGDHLQNPALPEHASLDAK